MLERLQLLADDVAFHLIVLLGMFMFFDAFGVFAWGFR